MPATRRVDLLRFIARIAANGVLLGLLFLHSSSTPPTSSLRRLVSSVPRSRRLIEARISGGFDWAPPPAASRPVQDKSNEQADLWISAGAILDASHGAEMPSTLRAAAAANLLVGDTDASVREFQQVARLTPSDADAWNDLAAARYTAATRHDAPHELPDALSAVEHALRLQPGDPLARFNRALILERMGLGGPALAAWHDALVAEPDARWRAEDRAHATALMAAIPAPFQSDFQSASTEAISGDRHPLDRLVRSRTQEVRTTSESIVLADWADAAAAGDERRAGEILSRARVAGATLAAANGDRFLLDVVEAIDGARSTTRRQALIAAHRLYRDGRLHYRDQRAGSDAELLRAGAAFEHARSPMAEAARYYAANALFDQSRADDSRLLLEQLLAAADRVRHPSLIAGAELELGRYYAFRGMWSAALMHLERGSQRFHELGERTNEAFSEVAIAEVHDRIGQFAEGWKRRVASMQVLSRFAPDDRLVTAVIGGAHAEIMEADPEAALSLLDVAIGEATRIRNAVMLAEANVRRARVLAALGRLNDAGAALAVARRAAGGIGDAAARARIEADIATAGGAVLRRSNPCAATDVLSAPIAFYETHHFDILLPMPYLERARARLACGDAALALADLRQGLANVERQRAAVAPDVRVTVFDTIPDLIAETVSLLLAQGRNEEAYGVVERARSRTLVEALGISDSKRSIASADVIACLPEGAAVLETALLPNGVATFCLTRRGMAVSRVNIEPARLRDLATAFAGATAERQPVRPLQRQGGELYDLLIAPMANEIRGTRLLFIVPDRFLNAIPFAALFNTASRRYLIQEHGIVIAPSGAFLCEKPAKPRIAAALILSDPLHGSDAVRLPAARREAAAIARLYQHPVVLIGNEATVARFRREAPAAGLIHYAGHAEANDTGGFLPLAGGSDGKCDATEISQLHLRRTRLVVLAGCATLIGSAQRVEGMPSLSRSFLAAGVPSVVGMLWDVGDETTAKVLIPFHRAVVRGRTPADALSDAQRALIASPDPDLRHPATWAAAEILGLD